MKKGTIKFHNDQKGWGYIIGENGDIYFHVSGIDDKDAKFTPGTPVFYNEKEGRKGLVAVDIIPC